MQYTTWRKIVPTRGLEAGTPLVEPLPNCRAHRQDWWCSIDRKTVRGECCLVRCFWSFRLYHCRDRCPCKDLLVPGPHADVPHRWCMTRRLSAGRESWLHPFACENPHAPDAPELACRPLRVRNRRIWIRFASGSDPGFSFACPLNLWIFLPSPNRPLSAGVPALVMAPPERNSLTRPGLVIAAVDLRFVVVSFGALERERHLPPR